MTNDMLQDPVGNRSRPTCRVYCKKCCRKEYHFLNIRGAGYRFFYKLITLGSIGLIGQYRCVCCGTPRIGRFDFVRGPDSEKAKEPRRTKREDHGADWKSAQRRKWWSNLFRRRSRRRYKHKPFKKNRYR